MCGSVSVVVDKLFNVPLIGLKGLCVWSLFCYALLSVLPLSDEEAGFFTLIVFMMLCDCESNCGSSSRCHVLVCSV